MKRNDVRNAVQKVVTDIQAASGRSTPSFDGGMRPMNDLNGFDSFNCVEASCQLAVDLGCEITVDVALFSANGQGRTMDEIVNDLCQIVETQKGKFDD